MEYETLERLKNTYTEQEIINTYKKYGDKPINYIQRVIKSKPKRIIPNWLGKDIQNEEIDKQAKKDFEDFKKFLEEFRNEI